MGSMRRALTFLLAGLLTVTAAPLAVADVSGSSTPEGGFASTASASQNGTGWVVVFSDPVDARSRRAVKAAGFEIERLSLDSRRALVKGSSSGRGRLAAFEGVDYVEPLISLRASRVPSDPAYPRQWGLPAVGAPAAWDVTRGLAVTVAVIDTGVDLAGAEFTGRLTSGYDFVNGDTRADDDEGHGTHVASTLAAAANNGLGGSGLAPEARIMPVKVLDSRGDGNQFDVAEGIRWAADRGARVINLSLGTRDYSRVIVDAINHALGKDVVIVAAAGNDGGAVDYPARLPGVVAVSALDSAMRLASFSNRGPEIDLAAPGVDILASLPGGRMEAWQGTSMAAPFVAATAALVRADSPSLTRTQVVSRLTSGARDLGVAGRDSLFGFGLLDAARAVGRTDTAVDDDIPGVSLPPSPVIDSLDISADADDVYRVYLEVGQRIDVTLTAGPATDFELRLFGPSAQSVGGAERPLAGSEGAGYPRRLVYVAAASGAHYQNIRASAGSGQYSLAHAITGTASSDDEIPGVELSVSPVFGTLARGVDDDDVFRVPLSVGDRVTASLTGAPGTDFDLYLFGPEAPTVDGSYDPVAYSDRVVYPDSITYAVVRPGTYYLDVYAASGAGSYTLTWSIERISGETDDDVPGSPIPPSPVSGSVSALIDPDDVFQVDLTAGQRFSAALTGPAGSDFDLYLFGPGATTVNGESPPVGASVGVSYPERIDYLVPASGRYYVDVYAYEGAGPYSLTWSIENPSPDDNIPGVAAPTSPIMGTLDDTFDRDDVFRVEVGDDQQLTASLTADTGTDFDLYLFGPGARDVGSEDPVAVSYSTGYPERVTYVAPTPGTYYLNAYSYSGSGSYRLEYAVGPVTADRTALSLVVDRPVGVTDVTLDATLSDSRTGGSVAGATLAFEVYVDNGWRHVAFRTTDRDGRARAVSEVTGGRRFRVLFSGDATHASSSSPIIDVPARAAADVIIRASSLTPAYGSRVTLIATARDLFTGDGLRGGLRIERLSGSDWVRVASSTGEQVSASVLRTSAARYRAVFTGSTVHDPATSEPLTVRPRVGLSAPTAPVSTRRGSRFVTSGTLRPRHIAGTTPVRIQCFRLEGGRWVLRRTVAARVTDIAGGSRYAARLSLPYRGTWRMRAHHVQDAAHATTFGPYSRRVTVR